MKKIVVISSSPRKNGNSEILADQFIKGATSVGHKVIKINLANYRIAPCLACEYCRGHHNRCVLKDDANKVIEEIVNADVFVMATPVYFYGISAQMKTFIDRTYPIWQNLGHKDVYYIISAGLGEDIIKRSLGDLDGFVEHLDDSKVKGRIYATNVMDAGLVKEQEDLLERAYEMGKSI